MNFMLRIFTSAIVTVVCCGCLLGAEAAPKPLSSSQAQSLAKRVFAEKDPAKKQALLDASPDGPAAPGDVEALARLVRPAAYPPARGGRTDHVALAVPAEVSDKPAEYSILVPSKYAPSKLWPLVIALHGGGEGVGEGKEQMSMMMACNGLDAIIVCPTSVDRTAKLYWRSLKNQGMLEELIKEIGRKFPIDRNRVYLCGYSMGGLGSYFWGSQMCDQFAAAAPGGGAWTGMYWPALLNTPLYIWHGKRDMRGKMFTDFPFAQSAADCMKELGYTCVLRAMDCDHYLVPPKEVKAMVEWMLLKKRDPYPQHIIMASPKVYAPHKAVPDARPDRWLAIDQVGEKKLEMEGVELGGKPRKKLLLKMGTLDARWTAPNVLEVKAENVKKFRVFISPKLMDIKKPLKISVNGKSVFDGLAATSYKFLIKYLDEHQDSAMVFIGEVPVAVE